MNLETIIKIKSDAMIQKYIRENSYWYKILNRNPLMFKQFEEEVKTAYHLRTSDKISRTLDTIELIQNVVSTLK